MPPTPCIIMERGNERWRKGGGEEEEWEWGEREGDNHHSPLHQCLSGHSYTCSKEYMQAPMEGDSPPCTCPPCPLHPLHAQAPGSPDGRSQDLFPPNPFVAASGVPHSPQESSLQCSH